MDPASASVSNPYTCVNTNPAPDRQAEANDLITHLMKTHAPLIRALNDPDCITKSGRVKLAAVARKLGCPPAAITEQLNTIRSTVAY